MLKLSPILSRIVLLEADEAGEGMLIMAGNELNVSTAMRLVMHSLIKLK
jgi:hypothetical protein